MERSPAIIACSCELREHAPQVHNALEGLIKVLPRLGELVTFPALIEQILADVPADIASQLCLPERWGPGDALARRILFGLEKIRYRRHSIRKWNGKKHAVLFERMEVGLKLWKENSVNWVAMKNALHFIDRMLGEIWRVHCNHRKTKR